MKKIFKMLVVLLFTLSVGGAAFAEYSLGTFQGRITEINADSKMIAVKSAQPLVSPSETSGFRFRADGTTNVVMCKGSGNIADLKVGAEVDVKYSEEADGFKAQTIAEAGVINTPLLACK